MLNNQLYRFMKKFLVCAVLTFLIACGDSRDPGEVAVLFNDALSAGNIDQAKEYCSEETVQALELVGGMMEMMSDSMREASMNKKYIFIRDSIEGERAWVWIKETDNPNAPEEMAELIKVDGKWKVVFSKN